MHSNGCLDKNVVKNPQFTPNDCQVSHWWEGGSGFEIFFYCRFEHHNLPDRYFSENLVHFFGN